MEHGLAGDNMFDEDEVVFRLGRKLLKDVLSGKQARRQGGRQDALIMSGAPQTRIISHSLTRGATTFKASDVLCAAQTNISFHYTTTAALTSTTTYILPPPPLLLHLA